jgi:hypothetical protein
VARQRVSGNHALRVITAHQDDREPVRGHVQPRRRAAIPLTQRTGDDRLGDGAGSDTPSLGANAAPSPDAILAPLGANQLRALEEIGSAWGSGLDADSG